MPGPHPAFNNPAIQPQYFQPSRFAISNITLGMTTLVFSLSTLNFVVGQLVRLIIPQGYGTIQLNNQEAYVISIISTTEVELDIDSRFFNPYIAAPVLTLPNTSVAQIMAIGDINSGTINGSGRVNLGTKIPGSFENISPL